MSTKFESSFDPKARHAQTNGHLGHYVPSPHSKTLEYWNHVQPYFGFIAFQSLRKWQKSHISVTLAAKFPGMYGHTISLYRENYSVLCVLSKSVTKKGQFYL